MQTVAAFHGGRSFEAIGEDFKTLERSAEVVRADVLDAWFEPSPNVLTKLRDFLPFLVKSSPPAHGSGLVEAISTVRGIPRECVLIGGGSSDLIFTCLPRLVDARQRVMILDPMYGEYRHVLETVIGSETVQSPLEESRNFRVDTDELIEFALRTDPRFIAIVNPNSPTGQFWARGELLRFLDSLPETTSVLVDETYIEYVGSAESVEQEAVRRPNLFVLKSMSKVYALSGMRVGYLVGSATSIQKLARWLPPWAVSLPAQVAGVEALGDPEYYRARYRETHALREALAADLRSFETVHVFPSRANFVLVKVPGSTEEICERMSESNVFVRNCNSMGTRMEQRFLRISVRGPGENLQIGQALLKTLRSFGGSR